MNRVNPETKKLMRELRDSGMTFTGIGEKLGFAQSTVQYHLCDKRKQKVIERAIKYPGKWAGKKRYMKDYMSDRYSNDPEFRERVKADNRDNQRRKRGSSNNLS